MTLLDGLTKRDWDSTFPCLVCGGWAKKRKLEERCAGGLNDNGEVAYCTHSEAAGGSLAHRLGGGCGCGVLHPKPPSSNGHGPAIVITADEPAQFHLSDLGNAERVRHHHGEKLRFDYSRGAFRLYDGRRWKLDESGAATRLAALTVRGMYVDAAHIEDSERRAELVKHAGRCESNSRITAMLNLTRSLTDIAAGASDFDGDPWLLNTQNGTVDLRTGVIRAHQREDFITKICAVGCNPDVATPLWDGFLERVFAGRPSLVAFVQRALGLALIGKVIEHVLFVFSGSGANGKTTLLNTVMRCLGEYAREAPSDLLLQKDHDDAELAAAPFAGVRMVVMSETDEGRRLSSGLVKALTGGESRPARFRYGQPFTYEASDTFLLATNHRPDIRDTSPAMWRRIKVVPFDVSIPESEWNRELTEQLVADEGAGILAWAVAGCRDYLEHGLGTPEEVLAATQGYRTEQDLLGIFVEERCVLDVDATATSADLYHAYIGWVEQSHAGRPISKIEMGRRLHERGLQDVRLPGRAQTRGWRGIGLLDQNRQEAMQTHVQTDVVW